MVSIKNNETGSDIWNSPQLKINDREDKKLEALSKEELRVKSWESLEALSEEELRVIRGGRRPCSQSMVKRSIRRNGGDPGNLIANRA